VSDETERQRRSHLGRGLSALLGEDGEDYGGRERNRLARLVPIESLTPGRYQPRHRFDEETLAALADSIRDRGILQPIVVRPLPGATGTYEIVAGERRWRAAQQARLHEVPVMVRDLNDGEALEIALLENVQRQNLTPIEEALGYDRLLREFGYTQEGLSRAVGKSRPHVANQLRLLGLPESVRAMLDEGTISAGHARALLAVPDPAGMAREVARRGLNVRQTEALVQRSRDGGGEARPDGSRRGHDPARPPRSDADTAALERDLSNLLGLKATIEFDGTGGRLILHYADLDQLDHVLHRLQHSPQPREA